MTDLQKRFCEEYVVDYCIASAAQRAGYQGDNARISAWQAMQNEDVQQYIEQLQAEAAKRSEITKDQWIAEFAKIGFSNIKDYLHNDLDAKYLSEIQNPEAIKGIKKTVKRFDGGEEVTIDVTLHDKIAGLTNLGRHFGWYSADNSQKSQNITILNNDPLSNVNDTSNDSPAENISTA